MRGDHCVLVTGATGAVGPAVITALWQAGYSVRALARYEPGPGLLPPEVEFRRGDIGYLPTLMAASEGCDFVVHMAALLHIVNAGADLEERYQEINVRGTENVVQAAMQTGVQRLVFLSTIAVYGRSQGQVFTEETQPRPYSLYARTKLEAERKVLSAYRGDTPLGVVLRLAAVYGPRLKGNYLRLVRALARGRFVPVGAGNNRRTLIYDKDVAAAIRLALKHPMAAGKIYNVTDGHFHSIKEIITAISHALGRRPPVWYVPERPIKITATIIDKISTSLLARPFHLQAAIEKYTEDIAVSGARIQEELGFVPQYDLKRGWQEAIDQLRGAGVI